MADYKAPEIGQLSAHDYEKVKKSFGIYTAKPRQIRTTSRSDRGRVPTIDDPADVIRIEEARKAREPFKKGKYSIEDEYRYMVSQGFKPESMQVAPQQQQAADPVEEPETSVFTPEVLARGKPGPGQSEQPQGPDFASLFADQISSMQQMFQQSMQQQQTQYMQMQQAQDERMAALQQQMQQSMVAQQQRPAVAGVQMAQGAGGTPMQIARRGVTGAFGRRGMRISSLNV